MKAQKNERKEKQLTISESKKNVPLTYHLITGSCVDGVLKSLMLEVVARSTNKFGLNENTLF